MWSCHLAIAISAAARAAITGIAMVIPQPNNPDFLGAVLAGLTTRTGR